MICVCGMILDREIYFIQHIDTVISKLGEQNMPVLNWNIGSRFPGTGGQKIAFGNVRIFDSTEEK